MCGIAGEVGFGQDLRRNAAVYRTMQESMARRGPDQAGLWLEPSAALIHRRLCVIDPDNGRQPMVLEEGGRRLVMVYNGELYNTPELRAALEACGRRFRTRSDTEVLLQSYAEWGADCLRRLNGIFAFAVWDTREQKLFLARDRMGVKPLFYAPTRNGLLFASELKTLLCHPAVSHTVAAEGVAELMLLGPGRTPGCGVFCGIGELPAAWCAEFGRSGMKKRRYWKLTDAPLEETDAQIVEHVRFLVEDAIRRQLVSDVPLCTFLSGGLDSSLISSVACRELRARGEELHTFSVTYRDNEKYFTASKFQPNSDENYIRLMADYLGCRHHWVTLDTGELVEGLFEAVDARDLPGMADVDSSLLLFCREIKKQGTVALSGECADELFGGYPWYRDSTIREREGFPWAQSTDYRAQFLAPQWKEKIDAQEYVRRRYESTLVDTDRLPGLSAEESRMKEMTRLNTDWFMQTLLDRKDRMSMYSGLEVRVPFCDWRIAEYLYRVPWSCKDHGGYEKGLLRKAMEGWLPPEVLWRKKSPYPKTHNPGYRAAVSEKLKELLQRPDAPLYEMADAGMLKSLLTEDRGQPWYGQLMTTPQTMAYFLQLNYWMEKYRVRLV